jgi:hypothetical protein
MGFTRDSNDRRRVDPEAMRERDAEIAKMRRVGVPFRTIAERLSMSLGAVQKADRRARKLADALATGEPAAVVALVDDEMTWTSSTRKYRKTTGIRAKLGLDSPSALLIF